MGLNIRSSTVLTASLLGIWYPLRIVFYSDGHISDNALELSVLCLVICRLFFIVKDARLRSASILEEERLRISIEVFLSLLESLPVILILNMNSTPDFQSLLLLKLIFLRHLKEIKVLLTRYDSLSPILTRILPLMVIMPITIHILACGWIAMGSGNLEAQASSLTLYLKGFYWTVTTISTVGYGDIHPVTTPQMLYANLTMFIGVGFFGYVLSNMASLLSRIDGPREAYLSQLDQVESFMKYKRLPSDLRRQIRGYYRYLWENHKSFSSFDPMETLPKNLRMATAMFLNRGIIEKVPLLKNADEELIKDIILHLESHLAAPKEVLFKAGDHGDAMYFILKGEIEITLSSGESVAILRSGSFFGESALLTSTPRNATATSVDYCDLLVLKSSVFQSVLEKYPSFSTDIKKAMRRIA